VHFNIYYVIILLALQVLPIHPKLAHVPKGRTQGVQKIRVKLWVMQL